MTVGCGGDAAWKRRRGGSVRAAGRPARARGGAESFRVLAYRRAATRCARRPARSPSSRSTAAPRSCRGSARRSRRRSSRSSRTARSRRSRSGRRTIPPEVVLFMRLPGSGRRRPRASGASSASRRSTSCRRPPRSSGCARSPGLGAKSEEKILKALARPSRPRSRRGALLGEGLPAVLAVVAVAARASGGDARLGGRSVRRRKETFRDLDIIATATDPAALTDYFTKLAWVAEVAAKGDTKATVVSNDGLRFDLRVVPPESTATCSSTSPARRSTTSRCARTPCGAGSRSPSTASRRSRRVRSSRREDEEALYEFLGYQPIPPELRENGGELDAARRGELPGARRARRPPRRPAHAHDLVGRRQEHARGDGRARRSRAATSTRDHRPLALPARRPARGAARGDRRRCGEASALRLHPARRRGEHPLRRRGRRRRGELAQLDWVVASVHKAREKNRPSACSRRWTTRTSTASGISRGAGSTHAGRATSTSSG